MTLSVIKRIAVLGIAALTITAFHTGKKDGWQSKFVTLNGDGSLTYHPDTDGGTLPDFSRVGYHEGDAPIPDVAVVKTVLAPEDGNGQQLIQDAINEVAKLSPDANGFRGAILLKKGVYKIADSVRRKSILRMGVKAVSHSITKKFKKSKDGSAEALFSYS